MSQTEVSVVGSGPNGLAAAVTLAQAGRKVTVFEARDQIGGGTRTAELTLPGFLHDICSAVHPLGIASPFFERLPLRDYGLEWIQPPAAFAHPLDGGTAVVVERSLEETARALGRDAEAYCRLMAPWAARWPQLKEDLLGPPPFPPRHPVLFARFGLQAIQPVTILARSRFRDEPARALFAGLAAHSMLPLEAVVTSAYALGIGITSHTTGWPIARGGSQRISEALASLLRSLGGEIHLNRRITSLDDLGEPHQILFDLTPRQILGVVGLHLPGLYRRQLSRYRYGPGVFKLDLAIDGAIPWEAPACRRAITFHLGGTLDEIAASERAVWRGEHPERPFVILVQASQIDPTRAPAGKNTVWAYCHVPSGSRQDMSARIIAQVERFAPGFSNHILAAHRMTAAEMETYNANYIGGDINGGVQDIWQFFTRPVPRRVPYALPMKGMYLCSSATPPGGGVHGICGYNAAQAALQEP